MHHPEKGLYRPQLDDLVVRVTLDHLLGNARVLGKVDLAGLVHGSGEEVLFPGKDIYDPAGLARGNDGELFLVGQDLDPAAKVVLLIGLLRGLLPVELRTGFDIDPDTELVDDRGDVLAALADRGGDVLVVDIDHSLRVAEHLDVDKAFGVPPDLALDL